MPSEKMRYVSQRMLRRGMPPLSFQEIAPRLSKLESAVLARIIAFAGQYHDPLGRIMYLHAVFQGAQATDTGSLEQAVRYAIDLGGEYVPYDRSDSYAPVLHEVAELMKDLTAHGHREAAARLCRVAIEEAETSAECLQDASSWEMAIDDLRDIEDAIGQP